MEGEDGMLEKIDSQYGYVRKVLSCLVVFAIVISVMPWAVVAHDVSHSIAESKHIQEQAAAKEFKSQANLYLKSQASTTNTIAVVSTYNTILDDLDELVSIGKIPGYDLYTDSNIDDLWTNLDQYKILLIDEDCMFEWTNPGPDPNKPIPVTTVGSSFYNHKTELKNWIFNGGRLFSTDQNDISPDYLHNVWWTWLPDELQVESNEYPSDYPEIGYGHYPDNLTIVYDPWIFSYPNKIDITKVDKRECHGRFTKYPGYQALVRDKSDGDVLEIYRTYGKGIIVLSHLEYETTDIVDPTDGRTWDSKYIENEIFGLERKDVHLELYIEDANKEVIVNKAPGDLIDIVAQLKNNEKEDYNVKVTIQVPADFELKRSFTRNNFTDLNEVTVSSNDLGGGKYEVTTLVKSEEAKQVIWRFKIPDNYGVGPVSINGDVKVNGIFCDGDQIKFNVTNNIMSIIVTNRKLLFEKYGDKVIKGGSDDVLKLLRELYFLSDPKTYTGASGIVYYVDHYNETAKNWDQNVDYTNEGTANKVANIIDDYIEEWAEKLAMKKYWGPFLISKSYPYLMIVGGDEIIPFYRTPVLPGTFDEKDMPSYNPDYSSSTPLFEAIKHNYYLTDSVYADTKNNDWGTGDVELATGRIVGDSAEKMRGFIKNGIKSPHDSRNMIVVADHRNEGKNIAKMGKKAGFNILNDDESPNTIETENWKDTDMMTAMKKGFELLWHASHGDYNKLYCDSNQNTNLDTNEILDSAKVGEIRNYNPFISTAGCHSGLLGNKDTTNSATDNLVWAFVDQGISGYLGSSSVVYCLPGGKLGVDFYKYVFKKESVGNAFKDALINFDPSTNYEKRTVRQFILYGVPWMHVELPSKAGKGSSVYANMQRYSAKSNNKISNTSNGYNATLDIEITNCTFEIKESFELPLLEGNFDDIRYISNTFEPVIPIIRKEIILPLECNITNIKATFLQEESLGMHNIPSALNDPMSSKLYTNVTKISGIYPNWTMYYVTNTIDGNTILNIYISPLKYNIDTREVLLFKQIKVNVTYQTSIPITITNFSPDKIEYTSGETINASVTVENVGSDDLTNLKANLSLKDPLGRIVASNEKSFDIASGESKTIYVTLTPNIPHGVYLAEINILGSGVLASSSEYITIKTGEIVNFTCPSEVEGGDLANFTISFKNGYQTSVEATGVIYIYDKDNIKVGEIYSAPIQIPANSVYDINLSWDTTGREIGNYTACAVVFVEDEQFGPEYCAFEIKQKPILHTDLPNVELISADPTVTSINVTLLNLSEVNETYKPEECITLQSAYMINSTGAGNFTLKFTNIPNANTIIVYKINATNQWIELDATTTADTVTFTMSVEDPPVVFCSGAQPAAARVPTLTPIGITALAGLLLIIGISRIKKRK
ncbi:MAG: hypothetical protein OCU16_04945 [Candidatus Methanospirare jalkutatii]|nr:hypothetical protein [Candidatus Methanospirare jalkutatii]